MSISIIVLTISSRDPQDKLVVGIQFVALNSDAKNVDNWGLTLWTLLHITGRKERFDPPSFQSFKLSWLRFILRYSTQ